MAGVALGGGDRRDQREKDQLVTFCEVLTTKVLVRGLKSLSNGGKLPILTTKLTPFLVVRLVVNVHLPRSRSSLTWADASPCTLNLLTIGQETDKACPARGSAPATPAQVSGTSAIQQMRYTSSLVIVGSG